MTKTLKRSTIYFDPQIHTALRLSAAHSNCSMSDIVNDAVKLVLAEDQEDMAAFEERANEPLLSYEELLNQLRAQGKI